MLCHHYMLSVAKQQTEKQLPGAVYFNVVLQPVPQSQVKKCSYTLLNTAFLTGCQCGFPSLLPSVLSISTIAVSFFLVS